MIKLNFKKKIRQEFLNSKLGMRESMGGDFFQGWGGGVEINFCLMRRGYDLVLGHIIFTHFPALPLQVIIAQSLSENIYLNRTKVLAKRMNCSCHIACADDNTQVIRSQSSQSNKLNALTWPDLAFGSVKKRSGYEIISGCLVCY